MRPILTIALNDLKLLMRDKANAFFTFVFPILIAVFFGMLFGGEAGQRPLDLVVLDESHSEASAKFIKDLDDDSILSAHTVPTRAEGEKLVKRGDALACIVLPKDYQENSDNVFAGGGIKIDAIVDPSRKAESGLLVGKLNEMAFKQLSGAMGNPDQLKRMLDKSRAGIDASTTMSGGEKSLFRGLFSTVEKISAGSGAGDKASGGGPLGGGGGWSPAKITLVELESNKDGPPSTYAVTFPQGIAWVLMSCIAAFSAGIATERARGTLLRLSVAPISRGQILCGKALGCFIACAIGIVLLMLVARLFFGVNLGNLPMLALAIAASSAAGAGVMMLISGMFRTEAAAHGAGRAIVLVLALIGGGSIPLFFMPPVMQMISSVSPFKWAIKAVEGAIWRGFTVTDMALPVGVLLGLALAGAIAGWISVKRGDA
ncbi:MAG: ABC transporter permease [Planctomycetes bacterium]|nr:ABC transporter permease [Planctomycetota bacterium]